LQTADARLSAVNSQLFCYRPATATYVCIYLPNDVAQWKALDVFSGVCLFVCSLSTR